MKRKYIRPATEVMHLRPQGHMLESSYVSIDGGGGFDVKQDRGDWDIEWDGTFLDDAEDGNDGLL